MIKEAIEYQKELIKLRNALDAIIIGQEVLLKQLKDIKNAISS